MRSIFSLSFLAIALTAISCTTANDVTRGPCDDLLSCAAIASPEKLNEHLANYGENGSCWKSLDRTLCEKSCTSLISQIAASKPGVPECAGTATSDGGVVPTDGMIVAVDMGSSDMSVPPSCSPLNCAGCCMGGVCKTGGSSDSCGQGGSVCTVCGPTQICNAARSCGANPNELITLVVERASIESKTPAGLPWDAPFGDPDPYVTVGSKQTLTSNDTLYPYWGASMTFTRQELMTDGVTVWVYDEDVSSDDVIARGRKLKITDADLMTGTVQWSNWDSVRSITFQVKK